MEPLSKASLNNQIVTMRHIVRKSKVHTINKLSREAKKLKEKKGNEEQILKNKKKAERFVNELLVIKKLNDDVVTKYALQNEVSTATILNNTDITLETRALARLAGHKFIIDTIQSFRNKYPDWKSCLTDLLSVLGAKFRVKKKPNKNKSIEKKAKFLKKNDRKIANTELENTQSEYDTQNKIIDKINDSDESYISLQTTNIEISQINTMLPIENNICMNIDINNEVKPINSSKAIIVKEKNNCDISVKPSQTKTNVFEVPTPTLLNAQTNKNLNSSTDLQLNMIEDIKVDKSPKKKQKQSVSIKIDYNNKRNMDIKPICDTVDSFFMTTDDKDYMSVYKPPAIVKTNFEEHPKPEYQKPRKDIFIKGKRVVVSKQNAFGNRRERRQQQVEEPIDTSLHPSWEAKRKQKSLAKFEGKKITFNDQD